MGLGDFFDGVGDAVSNVGKGAVWAANPTHWDDIADTAGKVVDYAVENPGKTWDTAFEVGRAVVKDQLDPVNLAVNAALIGATVATGGAAAPAFVAKLGLTGKSAAAGVSAVKGADTALDITRGTKAVVKGIDTARDVSKTTGRLGSFAQDLKAIGTGVKEGTGLQKVGRVFDAGLEVKGAAREAVGLSRYGGMTAWRAKKAERILEAGADSGKVGQALTKLGAKKMAGPANPLADPGVYNRLDRVRHRYNQTKNLTTADEQVENVGKAVEIAADPEKAAMDAAIKEADRRGIGSPSNYTDPGQAESPYSDTEQTVGKKTSSMYGQQGAGGNASGPPPISSNQPSQPADLPSQKTGSRTANRGYYLKGRQRFWEGSNRQAFGGITGSYDWRQVEPLRPIATGGRGKQKSKNTGSGDLNEQGAPVNFSPEVPPSGNYAMSTGQQPEGSTFPTMIEPGKAGHYLKDVQPMPLGTTGVGPATPKNSGAIEAYGSSEDDYGMDNDNQMFMAFSGSSRKALGPQPNTTTYAAGTRAQRRRSGQSTTGINPSKLGGSLF